MTTTKQQPSKELRIASVKATIWANETSAGKRYNVTLARLYRDEEQWRTSDSLGRDDLLTAAKLLDQAHSWICEQD